MSESAPVSRPLQAASSAARSHEFQPPFKVHLCWFDRTDTDPRCAVIARELHEILHRPLRDDALHRPGIEIPVEYGRSLPGLLDALDAGREPTTGVRAVIAILDAAAYASPADRRTVERALEHHGAQRREVFLPVIVGGAWHRELVCAPGIEPITIDPAIDDGRRSWMLGIKVCTAAGSALLARAGSEPPRPSVLFSHARADGAPLTRRLAAYFREHAGIDAWYDAEPMFARDRFARRLSGANGGVVVLVVRTDRYSESPECALELLAAKQARTPIVTLLATEDGEVATSAYGGNHRTIAWREGREFEVAARCVQAWLHGHHFRASAAAALALAGLPADSDILPRHPELLDLIGVSRTGRRLVVHPDPPLTDAETTVLRTAHPTVRIATPTTLLGRVLLAQDPEPPLTGTTLAFSLSMAEDLPRLIDGKVDSGLTQDHVDDVVYSIVLATLRSGARIAYGGNFRRDSDYTRYLVELHRSYGGLGTRGSAQLRCFLDPGGRERIDLGALEFEPVDVEPPQGSERHPEMRPVLWRLAMREVVSEQCAGRILLGGRTRPEVVLGDGGYLGAWPGLLEEAWRTLRRDCAVYIVGGFGGAARLIADMLTTGAVPAALTRAHHTSSPVAARTAQLDMARRSLAAAGASPEVLLQIAPGHHADIEDLARLVLERWQRFEAGERAAWPNGLDLEENRRLMRSTDRTEITHLVFEGLRRIGRGTGGALQVALYHGDIASVPKVDGYAVTATPGVPSVGALAALESHIERPRGEPSPPTPAPPIALVPVGTGDLSGSHMLIAQLALPPSGQSIEAAAIEELACNLAARANDVGIESIACPVFATTLGLSIGESASAMVRGFRRGRGYHPAKLVLCEVDVARYAQLHDAFGSEAVELRAGMTAPVRPIPPVLHVDVDERGPSGAVGARVTLYVPDAAEPVAPRWDAAITAESWAAMGRRLRRFEDTEQVGRALWRELLSPAMQEQLTRHAGRPLMILCDRSASGIPWELMLEDRDDTQPLAGGIVRRIALSGPFRSPVAQFERSLLRVLVVADPCGDLDSAVPEADAVRAALGGRADVIVDPLYGKDATVAAVKAQLGRRYHDVFHYAGHAFFDEVDPDRSGLVLADGNLVAADLPATALQLVYLSACESGRVRDLLPVQAPRPVSRDGRSIAEAFLRAGVRSFVGTFYPVDDASARRFASNVHATLAAGKTLGDAMRMARGALHGERSPDWGNFLLYGDDGLIL